MRASTPLRLAAAVSSCWPSAAWQRAAMWMPCALLLRAAWGVAGLALHCAAACMLLRVRITR